MVQATLRKCANNASTASQACGSSCSNERCKVMRSNRSDM
eukprot:CAMPEP_0170426822 /NCGR_PEP_ID=MMETSP0117_2-20130122/38879_1 /TAXON_ID=400756 /ORGANISM="Durinskia baltica, Strain CSIRO CS-38" /LENGTH=39 /DNA_ID= /DNA_START= /DNA_END= /DNA_ORIENTATION=